MATPSAPTAAEAASTHCAAAARDGGSGEAGDRRADHARDVVEQRVEAERARCLVFTNECRQLTGQSAGEGRPAAAAHEQQYIDQPERGPAEQCGSGEEAAGEDQHRRGEHPPGLPRTIHQHADQRCRHHVRNQQGGNHRPADGSASGSVQGKQHQRHPCTLVGDSR